ncbi:hypothetical protein AB0J83_20155 [Actinoplanes sp. NPDC049596]|uniref:hypothetical protein n=1 Tax=unclassified Actinoplanes TaxID=2626549 RepID=UPI003417A7CC
MVDKCPGLFGPEAAEKAVIHGPVFMALAVDASVPSALSSADLDREASPASGHSQQNVEEFPLISDD